MKSFTVRCPHCESAFPVDPDKVPDGGVRARCTTCEGIFFVAKPVVVDAPTSDAAPTPPFVAEPQAAPVAEPEPAPDPEPEPVVAEEPEPHVEPSMDDAGFGSFDDEFDVVDSTPASHAVETDEADRRADFVVEAIEVGEPPTVEVDEDPTIEVDEPPMLEVDDPLTIEVEAPTPEVETPPSEVEAPTPEIEEEIPAVPTGFQFGKRDPHEKARRLARVLVSDMITYNPHRHTQALANDSLAQDFEGEIAKSWQEYVDQVGADIAQSTPYWIDALNEVLAGGREVF